ncbi:hypothetical protein [Cytobacillus oceanisediminis]|uniref:hypothetical protein n=1 Tax=Cytobacillus oceanisediminis TaxID=665099 RepID=UPI0020798B62|nr:hypothetical protein [Cytobacillus oceanisediminis]USK43734.1 hypothetical protein LIT27_24670 [Cytobacillus oceanisediminis]
MKNPRRNINTLKQFLNGVVFRNSYLALNEDVRVNDMKPDTQYECIDHHCKTVIIGTRRDAVICPRCEGPVIQKPFKPKQNDNYSEPLLSITLDNEEAVPKVIYQGKEITHKQSVSFEWETDTCIPGGLTYSIEHIDGDGKQPVSNKIERRLRGHI